MIVYPTVLPGVAWPLAVAVMVRTETVTVVVQRVSVLPLAQLLLDVVEVIVLARLLFPVSGLLTVTEKVMVAAAPTARFPVQVRFGLANDTVPAVAAASPL